MNAWTRWRSGLHVGTRVGKRVLLLFVAFGLAPALLTLTLTHWRVREALTEQHYSRVGETVEALGLALWERLRMADELAAVLLYLGCARAGAVYLPVNTAYTASEVEYFLTDAEPTVFVCDPARKDSVTITMTITTKG